MRGKEALRELAEDWRFGGSFIDDIGNRRDLRRIELGRSSILVTSSPTKLGVLLSATAARS